MDWRPEHVKFKERQKNLRRVKELRAELRKFERAHNDEGNNEKMDSFCLEGIKRIETELSYLSGRI
ncbi:hypothetical protein C4J81_10340 [Deltaproteobacteria bacterium Smac51]|nr:hypothetical protein C4J81_10340 [Deltaproteobacteria bacterium Smac51]